MSYLSEECYLLTEDEEETDDQPHSFRVSQSLCEMASQSTQTEVNSSLTKESLKGLINYMKGAARGRDGLSKSESLMTCSGKDLTMKQRKQLLLKELSSLDNVLGVKNYGVNKPVLMLLLFISVVFIFFILALFLLTGGL